MAQNAANGLERELDAMIAEKVMGYRWEAVPPDFNGSNEGRCLVPPSFVKHNGWLPSIGKIAEKWMVPHFSTDIATAWQVVEKLAPGNSWNGIHFNLYRCAHGYQATFERDDFEDQPNFKAEECADTAPLAICLASLKAVSHE